MDYGESFGWESSEFLTCACCFARVNDDGSDAFEGRTPESPPKRRSLFCKVSRERERAWRVLKNERERAWRFCYWANNTKFPLVTTGEMEHRRRRICNDDQLSKFPLFTIGKTEPRRRIRYPLTRERELDWPLEDQHLSAGIGTLVPPEDKSIKQEVGGGSSKQEIGGSSTAASSSNVPIIICQYCRETAAALEKKSDTTQMSLRLSMLKHYQCPWHLNQNTGAHPYVPQDSAQELGGSSTSENNEAPSSSYHPPPPSQDDEYRTNPKRSKNQ